MFEPFILVLRQQQDVAQVSTDMSRNTTAGEEINSVVTTPRRIKMISDERDLRLTHEGYEDEESSEIYRAGVGQILQLGPYPAQDVQHLFSGVHSVDKAEMTRKP